MSYGYVTTEQLNKAHGVRQTTGRDPSGFVVWVYQENDPLGGPLSVTPEGVVVQQAWAKGLVR